MNLTKVRSQNRRVEALGVLLTVLLVAGVVGVAQTAVTPRAFSGAAGQVFLFDNQTEQDFTGLGIVFDQPVSLEKSNIVAFGGNEVTLLDVTGRTVWIDATVVPGGTLQVALTGDTAATAEFQYADWTASSQERNKIIVKRYTQEGYGQWNFDTVDEIFADSFTYRLNGANSGPVGAAGVKKTLSGYQAMFPDFTVFLHEEMAEGEYVAVRVNWGGGAPGINIFQIVDRRIVEALGTWDRLSVLILGGFVPWEAPYEHVWCEASETGVSSSNADEKKAIVRQLFEEVWNQGNLDKADVLIAQDYVHCDPSKPLFRDLDGFKQFIGATRTGFPDIQISIENIVAEGDLVAAAYTASGTHTGDYMGIPQTGNAVEITGVTIFRIGDGKVAEAWWVMDTLRLLQQLGVLPEDLPF